MCSLVVDRRAVAESGVSAPTESLPYPVDAEGKAYFCPIGNVSANLSNLH